MINAPTIVSRRQRIGNAIVGEHGKPELVVPLTRSGDVADKKIRSDKAKSDFLGNSSGGKGGNSGSKGGNGKQQINLTIPLTTENYIDVEDHVVRNVQRKLLRFSDSQQ
jgi:hypothetical protein